MYIAARRSSWPALLLSLGVAMLVALFIGFFSGIGAGNYAAAMVVVAVVGTGVLLDYRVGVWTLIVVMPLSGTHLIPREMFGVTGINASNLVLVATVLGYFVNRSKLQSPNTRPAMDRWVLLLLVIPFLLAGLNGARLASSVSSELVDLEVADFDSTQSYLLAIVIKPLFFVVYAWLVAAAVRDSKRPEMLMWPVLISALIFCAVAFTGAAYSGLTLEQMASPNARKTFAWTGLHNNDLGPMMVGVAAICLHVMPTQKLGLKSALLLTLLLCVAAAMLTFSRNAFLALGVVAVGYFLSGRNLAKLGLGVAIFLVALMFMPREFVGRALTGVGNGGSMIKNAKEDALTAGRVGGVWMPVLEAAAESPVWGIGLDGIVFTPAVHNEETGDYFGHPHNAYLRAILEAGVIGLALFMAYYIGLFRRARALMKDIRLRPEERAMAQAGMWALVVLGVQGTTGGSLTPIPSQVFVWCAIGFVYGLHARAIAQEPVGAPRVLRRKFRAIR